MRVSIVALGLSVWLVCGVLSAGAFNAYFRGEFPTNYMSGSWARDQQAKALVLVPFGPLGLFMMTFLTDFYRHGWTLSRQPLPCKSNYPQIVCKS